MAFDHIYWKYWMCMAVSQIVAFLDIQTDCDMALSKDLAL